MAASNQSVGLDHLTVIPENFDAESPPEPEAADETAQSDHNGEIERAVVAFVFAAVADISGEELTCIRQEKAQYGSVRPDS